MTGIHEDAAVCWCALGAIRRVVGPSGHVTDAWDALRASAHVVSIVDWNDAPSRTQAEVVAAFREAAAKAEGRTNG
jgi:hypothetical protein